MEMVTACSFVSREWSPCLVLSGSAPKRVNYFPSCVPGVFQIVVFTVSPCCFPAWMAQFNLDSISAKPAYF